MKKTFTLFLAVIILCIFKTNTVTAQVNTQDSLVLVALYNNTDGAHWHNHTNWLTTAPVSTWFGISLNQNRISIITLSFNNLNGSIPSEIENLTNLNYLGLAANNLSGNIPSGIGNCTHLVYLGLNNNQLSGSIPPELGNLTSLRSLYLSDNKLSGTIPSTLINLKLLRYGKRLYLYNNEFTFAGMERVARYLHKAIYAPQAVIPLHKNDSTLFVSAGGVPYNNTYKWYKDGILFKTKAGDSTLQLKTSGYYYVIVTNSVATSLTLQSDSKIDSNAQVNVQDSLALVALYNSTNGAKWVNNTNWLTTVPVVFWYGINVTDNRVSEINLEYNKLSGNIPKEIGNLTPLKVLNLSNNQLSDTIPGSLVNLRKLIALNLATNKFTFAGMGRIANAFSFAIYSPQASIPLHKNGNTLSVSVGSLPYYNTYYWYRNRALIKTKVGDSTFKINTSGSYTVRVTNSVATGLILQSNKVDSIGPINIKDSLALVALYNSTDGAHWKSRTNWLTSAPISTWYGIKLIVNRVSTINLIYNNLNGSIPPELGNLSDLEALYLNSNQLSGSIPPELGNLSNLNYLYLNNNQLSGSIPKLLLKLKGLNSLKLEANKFTFTGMEEIVRAFSNVVHYSPQAIIPLHKNGNELSVSVGSIPYNNTYYWYKDGKGFKTKRGDSTYHPKTSGAYYVKVTNSVATRLTLHSDTINYVADDNLIASQTSQLNINNKVALNIYPNPAKSNATIVFNATGKYTIIVTDVSGKTLQIKSGVANKNANIVQLDVSKYASGIYLITIVDEKNKRQTVKLSKE